MTFDIDKIVESKRRFRARQAALPIEEKLRILEELRERDIAIRSAAKMQPEDSLLDARKKRHES